MQLLGSAIGNIMRGKLSPVIERVYAIAAKLKKLPELPPELAEEEYSIEYVSPLARAQKALELNNLTQALAIMGQLVQIQAASGQIPDVLDKFNFDKAAEFGADVTNLAPQLIRDDSEVEEIRSGRMEQQQQTQQMALLQQGAEAAKVGGEADKAINESKQVGAAK
jgi:hypothetical protein